MFWECSWIRNLKQSICSTFVLEKDKWNITLRIQNEQNDPFPPFIVKNPTSCKICLSGLFLVQGFQNEHGSPPSLPWKTWNKTVFWFNLEQIFSLYANSFPGLWERYTVVTMSCETFVVWAMMCSLKNTSFQLSAGPVELSLKGRALAPEFNLKHLYSLLNFQQ